MDPEYLTVKEVATVIEHLDMQDAAPALIAAHEKKKGLHFTFCFFKKGHHREVSRTSSRKFVPSPSILVASLRKHSLASLTSANAALLKPFSPSHSFLTPHVSDAINSTYSKRMQRRSRSKSMGRSVDLKSSQGDAPNPSDAANLLS